VEKKTLDQVFRIFGRIPAVPDECIQRLPIEFGKIIKSFLATGRLALRRNQYHAPLSALKSFGAASRRTVVNLHVNAPSKIQL
jgi:hypothetical protein